MRLLDDQLRRLPIPVRPCHQETIGSYLTRLAHANNLRVARLLHQLGLRWSSTFTPATDQIPEWTDDTLTRLAILSGQPTETLTAALPAITERGSTPKDRQRALLPACIRCTARKSTTTMVIRRARATDYLCDRHNLWLRATRPIDLNPLPEIRTAQRHHDNDKAVRRYEQVDIEHAHGRAKTITAEWLERHWHPVLQQRWEQRLHQLGVDTASVPSARPELQVIIHPEMLGLAAVLLDHQAHPPRPPTALCAQLGRRLDFPCPMSPDRDDPLHRLLRSRYDQKS